MTGRGSSFVRLDRCAPAQRSVTSLPTPARARRSLSAFLTPVPHARDVTSANGNQAHAFTHGRTGRRGRSCQRCRRSRRLGLGGRMGVQRCHPQHQSPHGIRGRTPASGVTAASLANVARSMRRARTGDDELRPTPHEPSQTFTTTADASVVTSRATGTAARPCLRVVRFSPFHNLRERRKP